MRSISRVCAPIVLLIFIGYPLLAQLAVGSSAPNFVLAEVVGDTDLEGKQLSDLRGQVVVLDFWAIWCTPCVAQIPKLNDLQDTYADRGVQFLAVTDDPAEKLSNFLAKANFDLPVVRDGEKSVFKSYRVLGRPRYYLINRQGEVAFTTSFLQSVHLEEILQTDAIAAAPPQTPDPKYNAQVITYGRYQNGEDPTYNGVRQMLDLPDLGDDRFLSQFILRPSLPGTGLMSGYSTTSNPRRVGVTYPNAKLHVMMAYVKQLTSPVWMENHTGDTLDYDLIYNRGVPDIETAFAEIERTLLSDLQLTLSESRRTEPVRFITTGAETNGTVEAAAIPEGAERAYPSIKDLLTFIENQEGRRATAHPDLADRYVYDPELSIRQAQYPTVNMVEELLRRNGLRLTTEEREITVYELDRAVRQKSR